MGYTDIKEMVLSRQIVKKRHRYLELWNVCWRCTRHTIDSVNLNPKSEGLNTSTNIEWYKVSLDSGDDSTFRKLATNDFFYKIITSALGICLVVWCVCRTACCSFLSCLDKNTIELFPRDTLTVPDCLPYHTCDCASILNFIV